MSLAAALADALEGRGGFELVASGAPARPGAGPRFSRHRGRVVVWPLADNVQGVWALIAALADGVVPVLVPDTWPPGRLAEVRARYPGFGVFTGEEILEPPSPVTADPRVFLALMTSGSTALPKIVATSEENLARGIAAIHEAQGLWDVASTGMLLPLAYSYALVNQLLWAVALGRRVVLTAGLGMPADAVRDLREAAAEMLCLVASQARILFRLRFGAAQALERVKVVNFAGAPFPVSSFAGIRALFPNSVVYNNYGCAEAMPRLTVAQVSSDEHDVCMVGPAIGDIELRVEGGQDVGPIVFRGSSASLGTLAGDGSLVPHQEWIPSGDLGRIVDGALHVFGRHDQVVKVAGERFSLLEIEAALLSSSCEHAMAWLETDQQGEQSIRAVVGGTTRPTGPELTRAFGDRLPRRFWPKRVDWAATWMELPNGKTDREAIKARSAAGGYAQVWPG